MFVLQISDVQKSDVALYYCFSWTPWIHDVIFLKGIFLQVRDSSEAEFSIYEVTQDVWSHGAPPGPTVTLQCSFLSHYEDKSCTDKHQVYWFKTGTNDVKPSFISAREECREVRNDKRQKCTFSKNVSSSDAGTHFCAVATCGEIYIGNATTIIVNDESSCDLQRFLTIVLGSTLALSFVLSAFFIYKIKTKRCYHCKASGNVQQRDEDSLVYSAPTVVSRKRVQLDRADGDFSTYTDVCLRKS
ncbi:uncharacterized protein LOC130923804 [Corythoichthys intestinalis]|uniref:uncharacterized protein LOC130923804 n=1 Tax=Corythoichthys intestinalis TaxID=161448 RepID=UPI0025A668B5|nr:uncharacterized protein LOC130923804 [Corythoichthys intestinalis]